MISYKLRKKKLKIWNKQITGPGWSLQWMSHHPLPWPSNKPRPDSTSPSTRSNMSHGIIPFSPFCHLFGSLCAFISPSIYITYKLNWRLYLVTVKVIHVRGFTVKIRGLSLQGPVKWRELSRNTFPAGTYTLPILELPLQALSHAFCNAFFCQNMFRVS